MLYQLSHVRMPVPRTPGTSAGSLRRCVRTVSDPGATTNSEPEVREKICLPNDPWLLPSHHYSWSAANQDTRIPGEPPGGGRQSPRRWDVYRANCCDYVAGAEGIDGGT